MSIIFLLPGVFCWAWAAGEDFKNRNFVYLVFLAAFFFCLFIMFLNLYRLNVVLKPEIARYALPVGLDFADKVGQEVAEMWNILKDVLSK